MPGDERINWNQSSREIYNFVRAICYPGPKARTFNNKDEILINKIKLIKEAPNFKGIPGSVLKVEKELFHVKTKDSYIEVLEWEAGCKIKVSDRLE